MASPCINFIFWVEDGENWMKLNLSVKTSFPSKLIPLVVSSIISVVIS